jgi:hypothetical protein
MQRLTRHLARPSIVIASLAATFMLALTVPIPAVPDAGRAEVRAEVRDRLPGWSVQRLAPSWEGAYTVVTSCADREIAFQFVPGHGLPVDDAWIQPTNRYAHNRLAITSDHRRYLLWRSDELHYGSLACVEEVAQSEEAGEALPPGVD